MKNKTLPLVFAEGYYIHRDGYIFNDKNVLLPTIKSNEPFVKINGLDYNLILLMIEYFAYDRLNDNVKIKFSVDKKNPLKYPLRLIRFIKKSKPNYELNDLGLIKKYSCDIKAKNNNKRAVDNLSENDVLDCLKKHDFKCRYCKNDIDKNKWHLDHIRPISQYGTNTVENIAPSCKTCNIMKGAMYENDFIEKCKKIAKENGGING